MKETQVFYKINGAGELRDLQGKVIGLEPMVQLGSIIDLLRQNKTKGAIYNVINTLEEDLKSREALTIKKVILQAFNSQNGSHSFSYEEQLQAWKIVKALYSDDTVLTLTEGDVDFILKAAAKVHGLTIMGALHDIIQQGRIEE